MFKKQKAALKRCATIVEIMDKVDTIVNKFDPDKIILFGSYATGKPTVESDLDLLIILNTEKSTLETSIDISLAIAHNFPMDIIVRTPREINRRLNSGDFFIKDVIENGKVLYERTG